MFFLVDLVCIFSVVDVRAFTAEGQHMALGQNKLHLNITFMFNTLIEHVNVNAQINKAMDNTC